MSRKPFNTNCSALKPPSCSRNTLKFTTKMRSSCSQMFCEIGVPINFAKFTGKHLSWSHLLINLQVFTGNPRANVSGTPQIYQEWWHKQLGSICSGIWTFTRDCIYWKNTLFYPAVIISQEILSNIWTPSSPSSINRQKHLFYRTPTIGCFRIWKRALSRLTCWW